MFNTYVGLGAVSICEFHIVRNIYIRLQHLVKFVSEHKRLLYLCIYASYIGLHTYYSFTYEQFAMCGNGIRTCIRIVVSHMNDFKVSEWNTYVYVTWNT